MIITDPSAQPTVVRTSRGLTVAGTRITLYTILEYLHADWPPKLIQEWLDLSDHQMADVLDYLTQHRAEVELEYQNVLQQAEQTRLYWDAQLQQHLERRTQKQISAEQAALRAAFEDWKAHRQPA
jgi:uncharacterized protein (DUF433 family)